MVRLHGVKIVKVVLIAYLGSTVHSNGECDREVERRVQAGWSGWWRVAGVICDKVSESERESVQDGSETVCAIWLGGCGADKEIGRRGGGGRVENAAIFVGSVEYGQD